jgi:hypothetical protein
MNAAIEKRSLRPKTNWMIPFLEKEGDLSLLVFLVQSECAAQKKTIPTPEKYTPIVNAPLDPLSSYGSNLSGPTCER